MVLKLFKCKIFQAIFWRTEYIDGGTNSNSAPDREHVEDDSKDSDNFLVLLWLVQFINLEVSLTTKYNSQVLLRLSNHL